MAIPLVNLLSFRVRGGLVVIDYFLHAGVLLKD